MQFDPRLRRLRLEEAVELIIDHRGRTPKKLGGTFTESGVQVISAKNVHGGRLHAKEHQRFVPPKIGERWMPVELRSGDVLLTSEAPLGEVAYMNGQDGPFCLGQRLFALRARPEVCDSGYLYYLLRSRAFRRRLEARASGTTAQGVRQSELRKVEIELPPLREQERIAAVLATLDDKIDSNRRVATLLEDIGQAELHARFVDFVDRRADEGDAATLPHGWRSGALAEIGAVHRERASAELPYIGLDCMPRGSTILEDWFTDGAPTGQASRFVEGDILFGKLRPYFNKVGVAPVKGRCSTEILVIRPTKPEMFGPLLGHMSSQRFIDHCISVSRGTRMPRAEWQDASQLPIALPPTEAAAELSAMSRAVYARTRGLTLETRTLATIRDALLPKLVSGQIQVPDSFDPEEVIGPLAEEVNA